MPTDWWRPAAGTGCPAPAAGMPRCCCSADCWAAAGRPGRRPAAGREQLRCCCCYYFPPAGTVRGWAGTEHCSDCCWGTARWSDLGRVAVAAAVARRTGRHRRSDYLLAAGTGKLKAVAVAETDCSTAGSAAAAAVGTVHLPQLATAVAAMAGTADLLWRRFAAVETAGFPFPAVVAERTRRRKGEELADVVARRCCRGFDSVAGAVVAAPLRQKDPGPPEKKE